MLDFPRMETLRLRFEHGGDDHPLSAGVHGVGRCGERGALGPVDGPPLVNFCVDRRGVWLTVPEGGRGVHVNGRPVQRMAMLRVGDAVFVDGGCVRLVPSDPPPPPPGHSAASGEDAAEGDVRIVLRGVGGRYHGRSFTLERRRLVGSADDADIRIDEPGFAERHAQLELQDGAVVLRDLGSAEGSEVNGAMVRDAVLRPGDQLVFDAHHRFVLEAPFGRAILPMVARPEAAADAPAARAGAAMHLPWLLLAAVVLAGLLALLLLFGAG